MAQFACSERCSSVTPTQARAIAINASRTITRNANIALYLNAANRYVRAPLTLRKRRRHSLRRMMKLTLQMPGPGLTDARAPLSTG